MLLEPVFSNSITVTEWHLSRYEIGYAQPTSRDGKYLKKLKPKINPIPLAVMIWKSYQFVLFVIKLLKGLQKDPEHDAL